MPAACCSEIDILPCRYTSRAENTTKTEVELLSLLDLSCHVESGAMWKL